MIIDFHTHVFPDRIAYNVIASLQKRMADNKDCKEAPEDAFPAYYDGTEGGLRRFAEDNDIDLFVNLPVATNEKQTKAINEFAKKITGGRILSFGSIFPGQTGWEGVLEGLVCDGIKGIKLHPDFQHCMADSREYVRILKKAEELGLVVVIHSGVDHGYGLPVKCSPRMLYNVLQEVKGDNIVAAHMGGSWMWDDFEHYLVGTAINIDTAFVSPVLAPEQFLRIVRNHGADKVLFGSDMPWESPVTTLDYLNSAGLTEEEKDCITHKNALRMLNISGCDIHS